MAAGPCSPWAHRSSGVLLALLCWNLQAICRALDCEIGELLVLRRADAARPAPDANGRTGR